MNHTIEHDELLDLVNDQDEVIGVIGRKQAYAEDKLASLRAIWFFIKNEDGLFWIPRRHDQKKQSPNALDGSTVGHVSAGESYEQAMIREVAEELNFDVAGLPYRKVGKLTPATGSISFIEIFELQVHNNILINYNKDDFSGYYWLSAQEIVAKFHQGHPMRKTLYMIMKKIYGAE